MIHHADQCHKRRPPPAPPSPRRPADRLARLAGGGAVALVIIVFCLRVLVSFSPELWWATDPRLESLEVRQAGEPGLMVVGLGPRAAVVTDLLALVALALALAHHWIIGWGARVALIALWAAGAAFAAYHATVDAESMRLGGNWIGAIAVGLAAMHLGTRPQYRRLLVAAMIGLTVPLAAQAIVQVAVDHPQTVADYEKNREQRLRQRGWQPGSAEARQFEVRLRQNEASGRFGLANVFGSVVMGLTLLGAGGAAAFWRRPVGDRPRAIALSVLTAAAATALVLSFSRGAILAMVCALAATGLGVLVGRRLKGHGWWALLAVATISSAIMAVAVLGHTQPPQSLGPKASLVFRWYYWQAATAMLAEQPVAGVGPGRFQDLYLVHKNPLNPEEVADPHNVFVTFLSTLGLGGAAWTVLLAWLIWLSGRAAAAPSPAPAAAEGSAPHVRPWRIPLMAGIIIFAVEYAAALHPMGIMGLTIAALVGLVLVLGWAACSGKLRTKDGRPVPYAVPLGSLLIIAALALPLVKLPTLGAWLIGALGFVAVTGWLSGCARLDDRLARLGLYSAAVAAGLHAQIEMSMTNMMAAPLIFALIGLAASAAPSTGRPRTSAIALALTGAVLAAMIVTHLVPTIRWQATLERTARQAAAGRGIDLAAMRGLHERRPRDFQNIRVVADEVLDRNPKAALAMLAEARAPGLALARLWHTETDIARAAHERTGDRAYLEAALRAARQALEHDPYNIRAHVDAADLAWALDRKAEARVLYRKALELSDAAHLIPHKQLREDELARIRPRLEG